MGTIIVKLPCIQWTIYEPTNWFILWNYYIICVYNMEINYLYWRVAEKWIANMSKIWLYRIIEAFIANWYELCLDKKITEYTPSLRYLDWFRNIYLELLWIFLHMCLSIQNDLNDLSFVVVVTDSIWKRAANRILGLSSSFTMVKLANMFHRRRIRIYSK